MTTFQSPIDGPPVTALVRVPWWRSLTASPPRDALVVAALLALSFGVAYLPVIRILRQQWATNDTYSFGVLVPFISGYLIWLRRGRLRALAVRPSLWGGGTIVAAAACTLLLGRLTAIVAFQELSLILMLVGLVALVLGFRFVRELWFPLAYLLLMLPVWEVVTDALHRPSQLLSARLADTLMQMAGIPVHRQHEFLQLPNITLEVASICSGVNFLIAVLAIGLPQAYHYLRGWLPKAAVMLFAVSVALVSNGVRVAIIGFLSYYKLSATVHGPGHILQGLFVSSFGIIAVLAGVSLLARRYPRIPSVQSDAPPGVASRGTNRRPLIAAVSLALVVLLGIGLIQPELTAAPTPEIIDFPALGEQWTPVAGDVPARFVTAGPSERVTARAYQARSGGRVELYIGSLGSRSADGRFDYRGVQLPREVTAVQGELTVESGNVRVNRVSFMQAGHQTSVVYWHDLNGTVVALPTAKAHSVGRILLGAPVTAKLIMVVRDAPAGATLSANMDQFVQDVIRGRARSAGTR